MKHEFDIPAGGSLNDVLSCLSDLQGEAITVTIESARQRTGQQNKAIHKYCTMMAERLNAAGYSFTHFAARRARKGYNISWTPDIFKREVWHVIQKPLFPKAVKQSGEPSTAKLGTEEVSQCYEEVNRVMAEVAGVSMPFPDRRG